MSEVYIHYGNLEDSIKRSQKVRKEISGYSSEIKSKITTPISKLSGSDSSGYASTASDLAWKKINALNSKADKFSAYESSISSLINVAKSKDNYVSNQIETIAGMYVQKRKWFQKVGDWVYNTFCVDLANKWDLTRDLIDGAKWIKNKIGNAFEPIVDWFKYGDGKYVLNIITSVVGAVAAIGGAIAAVIAIPFSGGLSIPLVLGLISAAAASVIAIISTVNSVVSVKQNSKALSMSGNPWDDGDGDPGAARYYGNQTKASEYFNRTDMGDKETNEEYEKKGQNIDKTEKVATVVSFATNILNLGVAHDYRMKGPEDVNFRVNGGQWNKGYDFTWNNIKRNIMHDMGFKVSSDTLDSKKAFNITKSIFETDYAKKFMRGDKYKISEDLVNVFKGSKITKNILDIGKNIDTISENLTYRDNLTWKDNIIDIGETVEAVTGLTGHSKFFSIFEDYGTKGGKAIVNVAELILD